MDSLDINIEETIISNSNNDNQIINNPFCPNIDIVKNRFNNDMTKDNMFKSFPRLYILCLNQDASFNSYFLNEQLTQEQYLILNKSIILIHTTYTVITETMYKYFTIISCKLFNSLNVNDSFNQKIILDSDVLVCCLFRFKLVDINRYLKQFNGICNFIDLYNLFLLNDYMGNQSNRQNIKNNHMRLIENMSETNYWTLYNNCKLNYTFKFKLNSFNLKINEKLKDKDIETVIKYLESTNEENNYLAFLFQKSTYIDASSGIESNGYKLYTISNNPLVNMLNNNHINTIYDRLDIDSQYYLIMNLLVSKDLCHLIINNKYILSKIISKQHFKLNLDFMQLYGDIFRYVLGYAWIVMYIEESIKRSFITENDRFIFDIDTASLLPWYPFSVEDIRICPYLPILVSNEILNIKKNILGIEQHTYINQLEAHKEITRYGIASKELFIKRINQFISGVDNMNILEDINWNNLAMSGSIMACCVPNYNTLMEKFITNINTFDIDFIKYTKTYYTDADIDIMCNIKNLYDFVDKIIEFNKQLQINIKKHHIIKNTDIEITKIFTNKGATLLINKIFIQNHIMNKLDLSYLEIISNLNNQLIKLLLYPFYIEWQKNNLYNLAKENSDKFFNPIYHEIFINVPIDEINIVLIQKDVESTNTTEHSEHDKTDELFIPKINYKFRISSHYLPHNFEFFQIKYDSFFSTVSHFHLPIVRSYYNGSTVYLTPSCISACMTFLNIDYKYFAGKKDPIEIINKYRMRGFGTILNEKEITKLIEYSNLVPKWKKLYKLNIKSNNSIMNILGILDVNHSLFNIYNENNTSNINTMIYAQLRYLTNYNIIPLKYNEIILLIKQYYHIMNHTQFNITTINKYGFINVLKKWIINAYNDMDMHSQLIQYSELINDVYLD